MTVEQAKDAMRWTSARDHPGADNQKVVIAFFSAAIVEPYAEHEDRIGRLVRAVVDRLASSLPSASGPDR